MKDDLYVNDTITIPSSEFDIKASKAGGPGGQHVNKTNTRISIRWNVRESTALTQEQKDQICAALAHELTTQSDLIVHHSSSRSQLQNKQKALQLIKKKIVKALFIPKKRIATKISEQAKQKRLENKKKHAEIKKSRQKIDY